jgi:acyl-CoA synthetase (AMP-forming)/AMP-acid ligase II
VHGVAHRRGAAPSDDAALADRVDEVGRAVVATGIEPGDRVAIWAPNSAAWVLAALGAQRAGAVVVPLKRDGLAPRP